jgi:hypothetical protein
MLLLDPVLKTRPLNHERTKSTKNSRERQNRMVSYVVILPLPWRWVQLFIRSPGRIMDKVYGFSQVNRDAPWYHGVVMTRRLRLGVRPRRTVSQRGLELRF